MSITEPPEATAEDVALVDIAREAEIILVDLTVAVSALLDLLARAARQQRQGK